MKGLNLRSFRHDLHKTKFDHDDPVAAINWETRLDPFMHELGQIYNLPFDFKNTYRQLSLESLANFSFDEFCKLVHSSEFMMSNCVESLFKTKAQYEIVRKIRSSLWRWGCNRGTWNEIVDAYDNIRNFSLGDLDNFEVRLDYSTSYNECGWSKYARIFIDGVFAFYLYHKNQHVLTIGFSIAGDRKVLIQQVQSPQQKNNRGLYKLPRNRMEFVIGLFAKNFPGYKLYSIEGGSLIENIINNYQKVVQGIKDSFVYCLKHSPSESNLQRLSSDQRVYEQKIADLKGRMPKISEFYSDVGKFKLGAKPLVINKLRHRPVLKTVRKQASLFS